jgi:hypothetical protein
MPDPRMEIVQHFFPGTGPTYDFVAKLNTLILTSILNPPCVFGEGVIPQWNSSVSAG